MSAPGPSELAAAAAFFLLAFAAGSLPFSVWIGRLLLGKEIRRYGDANPGATNVFRAGGNSTRGKVAGLLAVLLDALKAALPVGIAFRWAGVDGWPLALVALAPALGHAFSPFLGWRGGKAVASTIGAWAGLTGWLGPTFAGLGLLMTTRILRADGWAVMGSMLLLLLGIVLAPPAWSRLFGIPGIRTLLLTWALHMALLIWTHRADLAHPPTFRRTAKP